MARIFNAVLLAVMIIGAIVTYNMKHQAEEASDGVARLHQEIAGEKDAINVLKAEWSMLSQPGRLQSVVLRYADHFRLEPFSAAQVATLAEIPARPVDAVTGLIAKTAAAAAAEITP